MSIRNKIKELVIIFAEFLIPIFQYVPCASIWFGIMSIPLITYFICFLSTPSMIIYDFYFFFPGSFPIIGGMILFIYSTIYLYLNTHKHRNTLIKTGPYKYVKHPQYLGIIVMTLGLTLLTFRTSPIFIIEIDYNFRHIITSIIWIVEVILYIILAKIEEISLKAHFGKEFLEYSKSVPFLIPFFKLKRKINIQDE